MIRSLIVTESGEFHICVEPDYINQLIPQTLAGSPILAKTTTPLLATPITSSSFNQYSCLLILHKKNMGGQEKQDVQRVLVQKVHYIEGDETQVRRHGSNEEVVKKLQIGKFIAINCSHYV